MGGHADRQVGAGIHPYDRGQGLPLALMLYGDELERVDPVDLLLALVAERAASQVLPQPRG